MIWNAPWRKFLASHISKMSRKLSWKIKFTPPFSAHAWVTSSSNVWNVVEHLLIVCFLSRIQYEYNLKLQIILFKFESWWSYIWFSIICLEWNVKIHFVNVWIDDHLHSIDDHLHSSSVSAVDEPDYLMMCVVNFLKISYTLNVQYDLSVSCNLSLLPLSVVTRLI